MKPITTALIVLATLLPAACTQEEATDLPGTNTDTEQVEITPVATIADVEVSSRASISDAVESTLYFKRANETPSGYGYYSESSFTATRPVGMGAQTLTFATPQYYLTDGLKSKIIAYHPAADKENAKEVVWNLNGTQDVMTTTKQEGNKANKGIAAFTLAHRLTQLQFYPYATSADVAAQWGTITEIQVLYQQETVTYNLTTDDATGSLTPVGASINFTVAGISNAAMPVVANSAATTTQVGASTLVHPQAAADYGLQIRISTEKQAAITVTRTGVLAAGTPYKINLRFWGQGVEVEAVALTIADWQNETKPDVPTSKTYPYVAEGKYIVFQDAGGMVVNSSIHEPWMSSTMPYGNDWTPYWGAVSKKMEIAQSTTMDTTWDAAWQTQAVCKDPWRMPTVMETFAIRDLRDQLTAVDYIDTDLLTATGVYRPSTGAWYVIINSSGTGQGSAWKTVPKNFPMPIRCVRDVE